MPSKRSILLELTVHELRKSVDWYELEVFDRRVKEHLVNALVRSRKARLDKILVELTRDRLKELCRGFDLDDSGRRKAGIAARLAGPPKKKPDGRSRPVKPAESAKRSKPTKSARKTKRARQPRSIRSPESAGSGEGSMRMNDSHTALTRLLDSFREGAETQREMGRYFEDLALVYFRQDAKQSSCYERILTYAHWAKERGRDSSDTGIDLVAKMRGEDGYCAIQAKFYEPGTPLRKSDIDSFIAASDGREFTHRAIVDTSAKDFGKNLQNTINGLSTPFTRIRLVDFERSSIDWSSIPTAGEIREQDALQKTSKEPRQHQSEAINEVRNGLETADRGQIIMACGTGKTYTAQLIAEDRGALRVLVLVPSLALVSQTVAEWCQDASYPIRALAVCSDSQVGKRRLGGDDAIQYDIHDLAFPATTDATKLAQRMNGGDNGQMTVVFSTYHSLDVISKAQREYDLPAFDLAICDEAHRTTGQIDADREASNFVRVHDCDFLCADKRLYMTATPRIYTDAARSKAQERSTVLCTMDDESMFGKVLFYRGFDWAIRNGLLSDYRVVVLALDEELVSGSVQRSLAAANELKLSDAVKILGSYKALMKHSVDPEEFGDDPAPVRRAMAFSNTIRDSKRIQREFDGVVREYHAHYSLSTDTPDWHCDVEHVDGSTGATEREELLRWLSAGDDSGEACRILSNVRCLGEGVDVPGLDAVLFLHPRKSQIDVVQAVGRVMRRAASKKRGYVILPIGIPAGVPPNRHLPTTRSTGSSGRSSMRSSRTTSAWKPRSMPLLLARTCPATRSASLSATWPRRLRQT